MQANVLVKGRKLSNVLYTLFFHICHFVDVLFYGDVSGVYPALPPASDADYSTLMEEVCGWKHIIKPNHQIMLLAILHMY